MIDVHPYILAHAIPNQIQELGDGDRTTLPEVGKTGMIHNGRAHSSFTLYRTASMGPGMRGRIDAENLWSWGGAGRKYEPNPKVIGEAGRRPCGK